MLVKFKNPKLLMDNANFKTKKACTCILIDISCKSKSQFSAMKLTYKTNLEFSRHLNKECKQNNQLPSETAVPPYDNKINISSYTAYKQALSGVWGSRAK